MSHITIYQDANYQGAGELMTPGSFDVDRISIGNDQLSSVQVPEGMIVTLYADAGFSGASKTFTADTPYVGDDFNDLTSSIMVGNTADVVTVYQDSNYGGASQTLFVGKYDVNSLGIIGNDQISSLKIPLGIRVTLYSDAGFSGNMKTFTADTPYVGDDFNDLTSSIEIIRLTAVQLDGPIVFDDGIAITAAYTITMLQNGTVTFKLHAHDSTVLESYDYGVVIVVVTPDKTGYTFQHTGHVSNIWLGSAHDDNYLVTTTNPLITTNWNQILQASVAQPIYKSTDSHLFGEGWEQTAITVAETVATVVIKIIGSAGGGSGSGSGGGSSSGS
jgi:hypothetical protein